MEATTACSMSTFWNRGGDLYEIAAAYAHHIVADHPYWDGNKTTGALAAIEFLETKGLDTSRLPEQQTYESLIKVADHQNGARRTLPPPSASNTVY